MVRKIVKIQLFFRMACGPDSTRRETNWIAPTAWINAMMILYRDKNCHRLSGNSLGLQIGDAI